MICPSLSVLSIPWKSIQYTHEFAIYIYFVFDDHEFYWKPFWFARLHAYELVLIRFVAYYQSLLYDVNNVYEPEALLFDSIATVIQMAHNIKYISHIFIVLLHTSGSEQSKAKMKKKTKQKRWNAQIGHNWNALNDRMHLAHLFQLRNWSEWTINWCLP